MKKRFTWADLAFAIAIAFFVAVLLTSKYYMWTVQYCLGH